MNSEKTTTILACPSCKKTISWTDEFPERPFCSKRCKLIDLGEWASEGHRIEGNSIYDDVLTDDLENPEVP